jgi:hypothetical protein
MMGMAMVLGTRSNSRCPIASSWPTPSRDIPTSSHRGLQAL